MKLSDLLPEIKANKWPTGATGDTNGVLDTLLEGHQALLPNGELQKLVAIMPGHLLVSDARAKLLNAVTLYDATHNATDKNWGVCLKLFEELAQHATANPLLAFYIANYSFLCCRNIGSERWGECWTHYERARQVLPTIGGMRQYQLQGFLAYNAARHALQNEKETEKSLTLMYEAAGARMSYLLLLMADPDATKEELQSARTQVWKLGADWGSMYGEAPCPITPDLLVKLELEGVSANMAVYKK